MEGLSEVLYGLLGTNVTDKSQVPINQPLSAAQTLNNAEGFVWTVHPLTRLRRFLCLGAEGGTYYVSERKLTKDNALSIQTLIETGNGVETVNEIKTFSVEGRTAKQNSILFALALCARSKDSETQKAAYGVLNEVCRIPTHLFQFVEYCELLSLGTGWGRAHRRAISNWYNQFAKKPLNLAMLVTKYRNRNDWKHLDVLRLAHVKPGSEQVGLILRYIVKGLEDAKKGYPTETENKTCLADVAQFLSAVDNAKCTNEEADLVALINSYGLVREHIPTQMLQSVAVWEALLQKMPLTALIRNLGKMTAIELISDGSEAETLVVKKLSNAESLRKARIHPFNVLVAMRTYRKGSGQKGKLKWNPSENVLKVLETAFYLSFKFIEPTGKRFCLAVDVSGSMRSPVLGSSFIDADVASAAMMMTTLRTEKHCDVVAFSDNLVSLPVNNRQTLQEVLDIVEGVPMGCTDCALPMKWARKQDKSYDVFIVYTDCETWLGRIHPAEALRICH